MTASTRSAGTLARYQDASSCESVQDIINIAATAEAFAVTALGGALASAAAGTLDLPEEALGALRAAQAEEQAHYDYLTGNGAQALTLTFTIPDDNIVRDPATLLTTLIALEEAFIAAYLAAAQEFVVLGEDALAKVALQIGAVEAEHRAGLRFYAIQAGAITDVAPNDVCFEKAMFASVSEAADLLTQLGFIGGTGYAVDFPGPSEIDSNGINNLTPDATPQAATS